MTNDERTDRQNAAPEPWAHDEVIHGYWIEPGKILAGEYPATVETGDGTRRKLQTLLDNGIRTFVDLTTNRDGLDPYEPVLTELAAEQGIQVQRIAHPIPDMGTRPDDGYDEIVETIRAATERGGVYFHCWGGIGRTATVAGCLLVDGGLSGDEALARIDELRSVTRKARYEAPQTSEQRDVVRRRTGRGR